MPEYTIIRRKTLHAKVEAESPWAAEMMADDIPGKDFQTVEDRIVGVVDKAGNILTTNQSRKGEG